MSGGFRKTFFSYTEDNRSSRHAISFSQNRNGWKRAPACLCLFGAKRNGKEHDATAVGLEIFGFRCSLTIMRILQMLDLHSTPGLSGAGACKTMRFIHAWAIFILLLTLISTQWLWKHCLFKDAWEAHRCNRCAWTGLSHREACLTA